MALCRSTTLNATDPAPHKVIKCKILSDKATTLLASISNIDVGRDRLSEEDLISEGCSRLCLLKRENVAFKTQITWAIKKSQLNEKLSKGFIESSSVEINSLDIPYLWLRLHPQGKSSTKTLKYEFVDISVHFKHLPENIYVMCDVAIIDSLKSIYWKKTISRNTTFLKNNTIDFLQFCKRNKLDDIPQNKFDIQCRIKLISRIYTCNSGKITHTVNTISGVGNLNDEILKNGKYSDITLRAQNFELKCHKYILAIGSPSLQILMKINYDDILEIDDTNYQLLQQLLKYMYTGKFRIIDFSDAVEFYIASHKFEILDLKDICRTYLNASLTEENISFVWDLSRQHQDEYLIDECVKFIKARKVNIETFMKKHF